jgi:hypothetical protein
VVLLFHGYTYKKRVARLIGALMFTLLALAFLVEPLGYVLTLEGFGVDAYNWLNEYKAVIISAGMILAVVDLFLTKPVQMVEKKAKR